MLINIPIESLEERYSAQWNTWFPDAFASLNYISIYPDKLTYPKIRFGEFLDVIGSNQFKCAQMQTLLAHFNEGAVKDGDILFFHDLWFPGLETFFYVRDALGIKFKIVGCLHAGTWDPWDYLSQKGMTRWAADIERNWLQEIDLVFTATQFHKDLITLERGGDRLYDKIVVTGFPIFEVESPQVEKENIVVFPHRLAREKAPEAFDYLHEVLRDEMPDWQFLKTKEVTKTKVEYYALLRKAKIAVSTAKQETWGIAQQEAVLAGCIPVVPNRLSYVEMYPSHYRYKDLEGAANLIRQYMCGSDLRSLQQRILFNGEGAIPNMLAEMDRRFGL